MFAVVWFLFSTIFFMSFAQAEDSGTQYVFIIDDSGSMGLNYSGNVAADPNRLSTFAANSMLMMLSPEDQVSVIRLNGGKDQSAKDNKPALGSDAVPRLKTLRGNRRDIVETLSLEGKIAAYAGGATPCRSALERAQETLNSAYHRGSKQVLFFLTDGSCEPSSERVESASTWLSGLNSYQHNNFKFFLLTFEGRDFSKDLLQYTRNDEGVDIGRHVEVNANDPIEVIQPFAEALAFSHGVEPVILRPNSQSIPAHPAAAAVRLLSVDTDTNGKNIQINLKEKNQSGKNLGEVKKPRFLMHQWEAGNNPYTYNALRNSNETGRKFKASAMRYIPNTQVVWGEAENASDDWRVIAIPEYHLEMKTKFMKGDCSVIDELYAEGNNPRRGEQACILVEIHNHTGKNVTHQMVEAFPELKVEMKLAITESTGKKTSRKVNFKKIANNQYFAYPLKFNELGKYRLSPAVQLLEEGLHLYGATYEFSTYEVSIEAVPSEIDFGTLHLGGRDREEFEMTGAFKDTEVSFSVVYDVPNPCIEILVNDKKAGELLTIRKGDVLSAQAIIADICSNHSFDSDFTGAVVMQFPKDEYFQGSTVGVPWTLHFTSTLGIPGPLEVELEAGQSVDLDLSTVITKIWSESPVDLDVVIAVQPTSAWPEDLKMFYQGQTLVDGEAQVQLEETGLRHVSFSPKGQYPIEVQKYLLQSERCCDGGQYTAKLLYRPNDNGNAQVTQDLVVTIIPKSKFDCWWPLIKSILLWLAFITFIAYIYNIFRKTHFMDAKTIHTRMTPLIYKTKSSRTPRDGDYEKAHAEMRKVLLRKGVVNLSFKHLKRWFKGRFMSWLKANPLRLGLPGQPEYFECLKLTLTEETDLFSVAFVSKLGMNLALNSPSDPDNIYKPSIGYYVVATSVKPRFVYVYNPKDLETFLPKSLHRTRPDPEANVEKMAEPLSDVRIYEKNPRPSGRNSSAGWYISS